jgi:hypothetical protein
LAGEEEDVGVKRKTLICALLAVGCGTTGGTGWPRVDRMEQAFTKVQAAEAEPMTIESRAFELRRQARSEYQQATEAMRDTRADVARRMFDRAEVDAELSLALARQEAWRQQLAERTALLDELQAPAAGGRQ